MKSIFVLFTVVSLLAGCTGTKLAYEQAEGLYPTAYVVGEHYSAVLSEAARLTDDPFVDEATKERIRSVEAKTTPAALEMLQAMENYDRLRSTESEEELQEALNDLAIQLSRLIDVVKGVSP